MYPFGHRKRIQEFGQSPKFMLNQWAIKNQKELPKYETVCIVSQCTAELRLACCLLLWHKMVIGWFLCVINYSPEVLVDIARYMSSMSRSLKVVGVT
jgi:hypothetical protein